MNLQTVKVTVQQIRTFAIDRFLDKEGAQFVKCTRCGIVIKEREVAHQDKVNALRVFIWCANCSDILARGADRKRDSQKLPNL